MYNQTRCAVKISIAFFITALILITFVAGCGSKGDANASTTPITPTATQTPSIDFPKADNKLTFLEIVPNAKAITKGQVLYFLFNYTDRQGVVHSCELPRAMTQGTFSQSEWQYTFQAYNVDKHSAVQAAKTYHSQDNLDDLPLVSRKSDNSAMPVGQILSSGSSSYDNAQSEPQSQNQYIPDEQDLRKKVDEYMESKKPMVTLVTGERVSEEKLGTIAPGASDWSIQRIKYDSGNGMALVELKNRRGLSRILTYQHHPGFWMFFSDSFDLMIPPA